MTAFHLPGPLPVFEYLLSEVHIDLYSCEDCAVCDFVHLCASMCTCTVKVCARVCVFVCMYMCLNIAMITLGAYFTFWDQICSVSIHQPAMINNHRKHQSIKQNQSHSASTTGFRDVHGSKMDGYTDNSVCLATRWHHRGPSNVIWSQSRAWEGGVRQPKVGERRVGGQVFTWLAVALVTLPVTR